MAEAKLTNEQQAVVDDRGRGLLVSAAAGSGKTKVLVERLFRYVEQDGADLDDFLIITYTRAAAAELRGKIADRLSEKLEEHPESDHLRRQMLCVYRADIKTVDGFCTALLRENCHLLPEDAKKHSLRPDFRVLDEQEAASLRERALSRVMDRFYETADADALSLADMLGDGRDDGKLASLVLELHGKLQAQADVGGWLEKERASWQNIPETVDQTDCGKALLQQIGRKALHWRGLLSDAIAEMSANPKLNEKYVPQFARVCDGLERLAAAADRGLNAVAQTEVVFPKLGAVKDEDGGEEKKHAKSLWDACKKTVEALRPDGTSEEMADDLRRMAPAMLALLRLIETFDRAYQEEKRRRNAADFSDQEHDALHLLCDDHGAPTALAASVGARYREVMVDEYQDTNEVQNRIFEAITGGGKNLFTVGDVKQSIYRFRLADPTIFLDHYNEYPDADQGEGDEPVKILLSKNFRSRRAILDATNFVFSNILSKEMGEIDYGDAERLRYGAENSYGETPDAPIEYHLISVERQEEENKRTAAEIEADFVAAKIRQMLDEGFLICDKEKKLRPVTENDIVILMRAPGKRMSLFRRALAEKKINCTFDTPDGFFDTTEVAVTAALLSVIDNPRQDVFLISVLRSPLFGFTADRLAELRAKTTSGDFYDALLQDEGEDVQAFLSRLHELREVARLVSVSRLLSEVFERCHLLAVFGAMPGGERRRENLLALFGMAEAFEQSGHKGLLAFVAYLRQTEEAGDDRVPQVERAADGVRIMSIHKSKGLEFPVVILCDLASRFSNMDFQTSVLLHPELGLGPTCVDLQKRITYPTAARSAVEQQLRREMKSEEMRILYVAMTRAKERLILVHTQSNAPSRLAELVSLTSSPVRPEVAEERGCMGDWILLPLLLREEAKPLRELAELDVPYRVSVGDQPWQVEVHGSETPAEETASEEAEPAGTFVSEKQKLDTAALEYCYPYQEETKLPAKLTATQLKGREADAEIAENATLPVRLRGMKVPRFMQSEHALTGAERGTAMHLVMQYLDFAAEASENAVRAVLDGLCDQRKMTAEQAQAVDICAIVRFLQSDPARRIVAAGEKVWRERRFSVLREAKEYDRNAQSDDCILLQGVVDCFWEEDGELIVLDFKTDHIAPEQADERAAYYRAQLDAYAEALSEIMEKPVREKLLYFFSIGKTVKL